MLRNLFFFTALMLFSISLVANEITKAKGLVFLMHGCRQTDDVFNKSTDLEAQLRKEGFEVAYIKNQDLNVLDCWKWFEDEGFNPNSTLMKSYFQEIRNAQKKFNIQPEHTYMVGFSSGAGMALNIAMCSENLVGGVALHAGVAFARVKLSMMDPMGNEAMHFMKNPRDPRFKKNLSPCDPTKYSGHLLAIHGAEDTLVNPEHTNLIMEDLGAVKQHQTTHFTSSCDKWLTDTHLTIWQKGKQKLHQMIVSKLGHEWGGGDPKYKYTKKDAPSTTDAIIYFLKGL